MLTSVLVEGSTLHNLAPNTSRQGGTVTDGYYSYKMDMWGVGCVIYEMLTFVPLFSGNDEYD